MKSTTAMNVLLLAFCATLLVFVFFSSRLTELNKVRQAQLESTSR